MRAFTVLFVCATALLPNFAWATESFEQVGSSGYRWEGLLLGARQLAMGNADMVGSGHAAAALANPAGLGQGEMLQFSIERLPYEPYGDIENVALSASWRGYGLSLIRSQFTSEPLIVRSAFEPEGELFEFEQEFWLLAASRHHRMQLPTGQLRTAVGAALRRSASSSTQLDYFGGPRTTDSSPNYGLDLGVNGAYARPIGSLDLVLRGGAAWQGLVQSDNGEFGRLDQAPELLRLGGGVDFGMLFDTTTQRGLARRVDLRLAYAWRNEIDSTAPDEQQYGGELLLAELLALRAGRDERFGEESTSRGIGLQIPPRFLHGVSIRLHRTWVERDLNSLDLWGLEIGSSL